MRKRFWNDRLHALAVIFVTVCLGTAGCASAAFGGSSMDRNGAAEVPDIDLTTFSVPHNDRPTIMIMDFDYSAVASELTEAEGAGLTSLVRALRGGDEVERRQNQSNLGAGVADLVLTQLLDAGQFRVLERRQLDALMAEQDLSDSDRAAHTEALQVEKARLLGAQYALVGSVTQLGSEERTRGVALGGRSLRGLGAVGRSSRSTMMSLNARIVDTSTGEVLVSAVGEGFSDRGGGLALGGIGGSNGLALGSSTSNVRETAVGEATENAVYSLIVEVAQRWERLW